MQKKVKVCCFCERWESGGIESFLNNVIQRLDLRKIQVDIAAACIEQSIFTKPLQNLGVRFFELSGKQRRLTQNYRMFSALLQEEQYDVVHLNLFHGLSLIYARIARQAGVPMRIAHSHNTALRRSAGKPLKLLVHRIARELFTADATSLWACSAAAAEFLFSKPALNSRGFQFIPNGIEIERFRFNPEAREQVRAELGLDGKFVVGNVGRLCDQKNQSFLLDVFARVKREMPASCLLLVGEGELLEKLKVKARQLNIEDSVIFYGTSAHVEQLLWAMDVFAFPSRFEGLGIAAVEAQTAGLPTLCSEYVPVEASVSADFHKLPLEKGVSGWAKAVVKLEHCFTKREVRADQIRRMGFDINDVSSMMMEHFIHKAG